MSDEKTVHAQQDGAPWGHAWERGVARLEAMFDHAAKLQAQANARAVESIDEAAKMQKESIAYFAELSASMRSLTLETAKQSAAFWGQRQ